VPCLANLRDNFFAYEAGAAGDEDFHFNKNQAGKAFNSSRTNRTSG
jgi:hypothetical protein